MFQLNRTNGSPSIALTYCLSSGQCRSTRKRRVSVPRWSAYPAQDQQLVRARVFPRAERESVDVQKSVENLRKTTSLGDSLIELQRLCGYRVDELHFEAPGWVHPDQDRTSSERSWSVLRVVGRPTFGPLPSLRNPMRKRPSF